MDSFNLVVPHSKCASSDLYQQYRQLRGIVALNKGSLLPIDVANQSQPCAKFGLHPSMPTLKGMYEAGDAALLANVGTLHEPMTLAEYKAKTKIRPRECNAAAGASPSQL
jgi:uncharacterized protein (DUF1501 family)